MTQTEHLNQLQASSAHSSTLDILPILTFKNESHYRIYFNLDFFLLQEFNIKSVLLTLAKISTFL